MLRIAGQEASSGIQFGKLVAIDDLNQEYRSWAGKPELNLSGAESELTKFRQALPVLKQSLNALYLRVESQIGQEQAGIILAQMAMSEDPKLLAAIEALIKTGVEAKFAVMEVAEKFAGVLGETSDELIEARASDVMDVAGQLFKILQNIELRGSMNGAGEDFAPKDELLKELGGPQIRQKFVIFAEDLKPSQTIGLDKSRVAGFVLTGGSKMSHSAILARALGIPCLVSADISLSRLRGILAESSAAKGGKGRPDVIIDTLASEVLIDPDPGVVKLKKAKAAEFEAQLARFSELVGKPSKTKDGAVCEIFANIGSVEEAQAAVKNGAEGIGLFRTEFLFLGRDSYPSIDEQFEQYRAVLELFSGKEVTFRTVDLGSDKTEDYLGFPEEENPALGYRGVRVYSDRPELLFDQLTAIYRAAAAVPKARVRIMAPMVVNANETQEFLNICSDVQEMFAPDSAVRLGVMVETPAAALTADRIGALVDFFSVGTNDLAQYLFAVDRQAMPQVAALSDYDTAAFTRILELILSQAAQNSVEVCLCGEMASDNAMTEQLLALGLRKFSVGPGAVLPLRDHISSLASKPKKGVFK